MTARQSSHSEVLLCDGDEADWPQLGLPFQYAVALHGPLLDGPENALLWQREFDRLVVQEMSS